MLKEAEGGGIYGNKKEEEGSQEGDEEESRKEGDEEAQSPTQKEGLSR